MPKEITELVGELVDTLPVKEVERAKRVGELFRALQQSEAFMELEKLLYIYRESVTQMVLNRPDEADYIRGIVVGLECVTDMIGTRIERARQAAFEEQQRLKKGADEGSEDIIRGMVTGLGGEVAESYES